MDFPKIKSFIKDLHYDLATIHHLIDFGRLKETLPIIERILDNIYSLKNTELKNTSPNTFSEEFWNEKLPANSSIQQMQLLISQYAHTKSPFTEEDLNKFEYRTLVANVLYWSEENIPRLKKLAKTPQEKKLEKNIYTLIGLTAGITLIVISCWFYSIKSWGLRGDFYQGNNFDTHIATGNNKTIDFDSSMSMSSNLPSEHASARWQGFLLAPKDGTYTFSMIVDDGGRLFIDNKLLIDAWQLNDSQEYKTDIFLSKGKHLIRVDYFNNLFASILKLFWSIDGGEKEIIPAKYLRH